MIHKLVAVIWDDAHVAQAASMDDEEIRSMRPVTMTTYGLLVRDDDEMAGVAAELQDDGSFRGVTFVPRSLVREIVPLGRWPKRQRSPRTTARPSVFNMVERGRDSEQGTDRHRGTSD
jgi:hypothetical protein